MRIASSISFFLRVFVIVSLQHTSTFATNKTYIIYLGVHQHGLNPTVLDAKIATKSHYELLGSILGSYEKAQDSMLYSYNKYINGFVADLTEDEVERIKKTPNVVSVLENRRLKLQTTRSWNFLGLERNDTTPSDSLWNISRYGNDVIIGNIDSGVWPESESFNDKDFGPIPSKWKGICMTGSDPTFKCNKKLIGARYLYIGNNKTQMLNKSFLTPRDTDGHGTHTLSTAGGSFVKGVSVFGFGSGIAKGGSPNARVATYSACWPDVGCLTANVIAAFEAAIGDGVDVLSIQMNDAYPLDYKLDGIAIGSFHAVRHGITMVASAGNLGTQGPSTVSNVAPWIFTVAASTMDRTFYNEVYLGNSTLHLKGAYLGPQRMLPRWHFYPLINGASAFSNSSTAKNAHFCEEGSLDPMKVKGKIVVCEIGGPNLTDTISKGKVVQMAGGVGMIIVNDADVGDTILANPHVLPASHLSHKNGQFVLKYIKEAINPTAYITDLKTVLDLKPAPRMATFSSRGPSGLYPQILKPDITAPGVDVIAAYSGAVAPSGLEDDTRRVKYYVMSGTSMSSPHVSGIVGLVKSVHPDWSPAAIRSALMTTSTTLANNNKTILDSNGQPATPFSYGAGHISPNAAANPGLIYNLTENDYLDFLCSLGTYTEKDLKLFTRIPYKCTNSMSIQDFNYPSITVTNFTTRATLKRIVTNVGDPGTYEAKVVAPSGVNVTVIPSKLNFNGIGEEKTYSVELKAIGKKSGKSSYVFGSLIWTDGTHNVRSPLVVEKV